MSVACSLAPARPTLFLHVGLSRHWFACPSVCRCLCRSVWFIRRCHPVLERDKCLSERRPAYACSLALTLHRLLSPGGPMCGGRSTAGATSPMMSHALTLTRASWRCAQQLPRDAPSMTCGRCVLCSCCSCGTWGCGQDAHCVLPRRIERHSSCLRSTPENVLGSTVQMLRSCVEHGSRTPP